MKNKAIIFFPSKINHWLTYLPLLAPLTENGFDVRFLYLPQFFSNGNIPPDAKFDEARLWPPPKKVNQIENYNRIKSFYLVKRKLLPAWKNLLKAFTGGAVVAAQDGAPIQRMMLNAAKKLGFSRVTMQDGYFVSTPTRYGWELEGKKRLFLKKLISFTPLRRFIALGFGTATDYCGLYGENVRAAFCKKGILSWNRAEVIGSPRFLKFREKVARLEVATRPHNLRILCLPSTFPMYRDSKLDQSQDMAIDWVCTAAEDLSKTTKQEIFIDIKLKRGYDHLMKRYSDIFKERGANILSGNHSLETLMAKSDVVITMGSTAALEAAVCGKPVIQVMPPYLYKKYMKISGIPVAKTFTEVRFLFNTALGNKERFVMDFCIDASKELVDIDPNWNSIEKATKWLVGIVQNDGSKKYTPGNAKDQR